jgi:hypothetical protein
MSRRISSVLALAAFISLTAWALPSRAALVTGGFSGEIFGGFDFGSAPGGFFGAGIDLDGLPITGTFSYDTANVPPPDTTTLETIYEDPTFSTDFLKFTVTINGRTYTFGEFAAPPGIQRIGIIDNTDQLQFDYQRFGIGANESISLRFISDVDFLTGTDVPTHFDFVASGVGLFPTGSFDFDLPNGDFVSARFSIDSGFARVAAVSEPATLGTLALGLLGLAAVRRRSTQGGR